MPAELSMNGRKKIETIQKEFTGKFNYLTLLFLDENRQSLDISRSLAEVRTVKGTDVSINAGLKVNTLEARFMQNYGLLVEVAYKKDGKVMHTKETVDKTLNELNKWCEENGCEKFEFKKSLRGDTVHSLQEKLFHAIVEAYPDAVAKKINKDNFMDVHLPSVNSKRGTHLFFNTAKEGIKFGFYCRDEQFNNPILERSSAIEAYAQGIRPKGNPLFANVEEAAEAALAFIGELMGDFVDHEDESDLSIKGEMKSNNQQDVYKSVDKVINDLKRFDAENLVYLSVSFQTKPLYEKGKVGGTFDGNEFTLEYTRIWRRGYILSDDKMTIEQLIELLQNKKIEEITSSDFLDLEYGDLRDYTMEYKNIQFHGNQYKGDIEPEELFSNATLIGDVKYEFQQFDDLIINIFSEDYEAVVSNKKEELVIEDFMLIHTLVTLYSAFASQSGISDSSFDVLIERIKAWDFDLSEGEKNNEIMKALKWFSNNYDASLFSKLKIKLNELPELEKELRIRILEDLRHISVSFFSMPESKTKLYESIVNNLGFDTEEYGIEVIDKETLDAFNDHFDIEYKSAVLENCRDNGYLTLLSIDVKDLKRAIDENDFSEDMLHPIGKVELGDWDSLEELTNAEEVASIKKDFKDEKSKYIVIMYCQGNYIHAFSCPEYDEEEDVDNNNNDQFGSMQVIELKSGYQKVMPVDFLARICQENEFIYLNDDKIGISYNMDISEMYGSPLGAGEEDYAKTLSIFEETFPKLKKLFSEEFEIFYFTYSGEYTANMWSFDGKKLKNASGWIGDFCNDCEDESERDSFVDQNYPLLKIGSPTSELLDGLRSRLVEVEG